MYNIAMIQQKTAELMFGLGPAKRTLKDLERAIGQANHAQRCVVFLLSPSLPFSLVNMLHPRLTYAVDMI